MNTNNKPKFEFTDTPNVQTVYNIKENAKKKYAFWYCVHDRINELALNVACFNRSKYFRDNFDIIVTCNWRNDDERVIDVCKRFEANRILLTFDSKNEGSYLAGPMEQGGYGFHHLYGYELICQLHADVYIMNDKPTIRFIKDFENRPLDKRCDVYAWPMPEGKGRPEWKELAYDFWFLNNPSPRTNIYNNWKKYALESEHPWGEPFLWDAINTFNLSLGYLDRGQEAGMNGKYESPSGVIHTKNFSHAINIFNQGKIITC